MKLIQQKKFNKIIKEDLSHTFEAKEKGLCLIEIIASCKSWKQNLIKFISFFKDDDLTVKIDDKEFPKLNGKRGLFDGEVAWNGNNLKGLLKTNIFSMHLKKGEHIIHFLADQKPYLKSIKISMVENLEKIIYIPTENNPAEDSNRRQWINFTLVDLPIKQLNIKASANSYVGEDDDDIKLIINGEIQKNTTDKSHKYWYWCGRALKGKEKEFDKKIDLKQSTHYIELWADRKPFLNKIEIKFGEIKKEKSIIHKPANEKLEETILKSKKIIGKIALYESISNYNQVNLRSEARKKDEKTNKKLDNIITQIKNNEQVEILEEKIDGEYIRDKSNIWHKVKWQDKTGYVLSSFIEIEGQEREIIIKKIKIKAKELNLDPNLMVALAKAESVFKPYATSWTGVPGIFQLTLSAIKQIRGKEVVDRFNIDENVDIGVRYFKWLYDQFDPKDSQFIEKVIVSWSAVGKKYVPKKEKLIYENLKAPPERVKEAKALVEKVMKYWKNSKRKKIILPSMLILLGFLCLIPITQAYYLNSNLGYYNSSDINKNSKPYLSIENGFEGVNTKHFIFYDALSFYDKIEIKPQNKDFPWGVVVSGIKRNGETKEWLYEGEVLMNAYILPREEWLVVETSANLGKNISTAFYKIVNENLEIIPIIDDDKVLNSLAVGSYVELSNRNTVIIKHRRGYGKHRDCIDPGIADYYRVEYPYEILKDSEWKDIRIIKTGSEYICDAPQG